MKRCRGRKRKKEKRRREGTKRGKRESVAIQLLTERISHSEREVRNFDNEPQPRPTLNPAADKRTILQFLGACTWSVALRAC